MNKFITILAAVGSVIIQGVGALAALIALVVSVIPIVLSMGIALLGIIVVPLGCIGLLILLL